MNKKLFIPILLSGLLFSTLSFEKFFNNAHADDVIYFDVDTIQALSHKDGVTVNFVNDDIIKYWNSDASDIDNLRNLYEVNDDMISFFDNSYDHEYARNLYAKWDDFKPVNNTLTWKSNVNANSYDVVISLNAELTEALYEDTVTETNYTMVNPFANSHYYWQATAHTNSGDVKSAIFDFYSGDYKRTVDIPSISNTRDVGGFTGKYGTMQQGLVFRSGRLDDVGDEAQAALAQLDIQTDLDLRNNGEGTKNPAHLNNYYLRTLQTYYNNFTEEYRPAVIEAMRVFTDPNNYPVMFHCAVGRDRTGTLAMMLQALCGASKEYIIHDYYTSMWSVTGAYQKSVTELNLGVVNDTLTALENLGDDLNSGVENFLRVREDTITHEMVGLSTNEIQAIRDIFSGKTPVEHGQKTFKATENYEGKTLVNIKALGHKDTCLMVTKGTTIAAPYELDSSMAWYSNGALYNFNTPINDVTNIYADYASQYIVTIHFTGISKQDEILRVTAGETITLDRFAMDSFDMLAISDEGKEISKLEVTRDAYINIVYMKRQEESHMKRNFKLSAIATLFFAAFALGSLSNQASSMNMAKADGDWEIISTRGLAKEGVWSHDSTYSDIAIQLATSDYSTMPSDYKHSRTLSYYNSSDYNFLSYVYFSTDNVNYIPLSDIYDARDLDYFFKAGRFRFNLTGNQTITPSEAFSFMYVKVMQGCEFPSYDYCANGGTKKKYVQSETTISKRGGIADRGTYDVSQYSEYVQKPLVTYTGIAPMWNNANYGNPAYRQLILSFGEHGVTYLSNDHVANSTERALSSFEIGNNLTLNGIPIYKIRQKFPLTHVGYDHGYAYFYVNYPVEVLLSNKNNIVPTFHIDQGTEFIDVLLPEVTLKFIGGGWFTSNSEDYRIADPLDLDEYTFVSFPYEFDTAAHPILGSLPTSGSKLAFNINLGDNNLSNSNPVLLMDGLYNFLISVYPSMGTIQLTDRDSNSTVVQEFWGFIFTANTDYAFEIDIETGPQTTIKVAINHFVVLNYTSNVNKSASPDMWMMDTSGKMIMDYFKEIPTYQPVISYGGTTYYDFLEGDPVYNFANVVDAIDLYDDTVGYASLEFIYQEGAVTDGRYNAGTWTLTIRLSLDGYEVVTKVITIKVHGNTSMATISYDDGEPIRVPIGSKLVPPPNPPTYREGDYDYVFDGWYFEGAKWDFENYTVQGDMHLVSRFVPVAPHYVVTAVFEGLVRDNATFSLTRGSYLPFDLFELEGATYEVYLDGQKITSLQVNEDITIVVRYNVVYTFVEAKEPTCTEDGNIAYWYSAVYRGYYFADPFGRELLRSVIIPKLNHDIIHLDYKDSSCHEVGNVDCYYCKNCHTHFTDPNGEHELIDWAIAKKPHVLTHHDAVPATCETDGYVEHWTCANEPGTYYGDAECTFTLDTVVINAFGHDYRAPTYTWSPIPGGFECKASITCTHCHDEISETKVAERVVVRESSCSREGQISYSVRFTDPRFNAQTKIVNLEKTPHTYVFVQGTEATKTADGIKDHYECSECHKCFIKNGENYEEVQYADLFYKYKSSGCKGSIATPSLIVLTSAGALTVLLMLRRKEDR